MEVRWQMVVEIHINHNTEELTDTRHIFNTPQIEDTYLEACRYCSIDLYDAVNDKQPFLIIGRAASFMSLRISVSNSYKTLSSNNSLRLQKLPFRVQRL